MTNQPNPHSREQLKNEVVSILALEFMAGSSEIVGLTKQLMDVFDTYTAEQSLKRAKEELEKVTTAGHSFRAYIDNRLTHLDKEIKASRLDAEGGE